MVLQYALLRAIKSSKSLVRSSKHKRFAIKTLKSTDLNHLFAN